MMCTKPASILRATMTLRRSIQALMLIRASTDPTRSMTVTAANAYWKKTMVELQRFQHHHPGSELMAAKPGESRSPERQQDQSFPRVGIRRWPKDILYALSTQHGMTAAKE